MNQKFLLLIRGVVLNSMLKQAAIKIKSKINRIGVIEEQTGRSLYED